jgi:soluble lytic murein transglycosylase-like protein
MDLQNLLTNISSFFTKNTPFGVGSSGLVNKDYLPKPSADLSAYKNPVAPSQYNQPQYEPISPLARNQPTPQPTPQQIMDMIRGQQVPRSDNIQQDYTDKARFPDALVPLVQNAAKQNNLPANILASLIASETGGLATPYQPATSSAGARGITQIIPELHYQEAGFQDPQSYAQALEADPQFSLNESARILRQYTDQVGGDLYTGAKAYIGGPGGTDYPESINYADQILRRIGLIQ